MNRKTDIWFIFELDSWFGLKFSNCNNCVQNFKFIVSLKLEMLDLQTVTICPTFELDSWFDQKL